MQNQRIAITATGGVYCHFHCEARGHVVNVYNAQGVEGQARAETRVRVLHDARRVLTMLGELRSTDDLSAILIALSDVRANIDIRACDHMTDRQAYRITELLSRKIVRRLVGVKVIRELIAYCSGEQGLAFPFTGPEYDLPDSQSYTTI